MDDNTDDWPAELMTRLGGAIAAARKSRDMSAVKLGEATEEIGLHVHRVAITRIERGEQVVTVPELVALGAALDADWTGWLIKAADGLAIAGERDERAGLRAALVGINDQLDTLKHNMLQVEEGPKFLQMPDQYRRHLADEVDRYRQLIESLESRREAILKMLGEQDDA